MGYEKSQEMLAEINKKIDEGDISPEIFEEKAKYEFYIHAAENAARKSKAVFVISNQQKEKFERLFPFAKQKVMLVRNGCDTTVFHTEKVDAKEVISSLTSNITPDGKIPTDYDKLAIFVGKFAQFKRVDLVLKAAKIYEEKLAKEGKKILTLIVGSGALDDELRNLQKSLGLKNLHFVGRQGPDIVRKLNNISDVFLAPSEYQIHLIQRMKSLVQLKGQEFILLHMECLFLWMTNKLLLMQLFLLLIILKSLTKMRLLSTHLRTMTKEKSQRM